VLNTTNRKADFTYSAMFELRMNPNIQYAIINIQYAIMLDFNTTM